MEVINIKKSFCELYLNTTQGQAELYNNVLKSVIASFSNKRGEYFELEKEEFSYRIIKQTDSIVEFILREEDRLNENLS